MFGNDTIEAMLDRDGALLESRVVKVLEGHPLELARFHALRDLAEAVWREVNPVSAALVSREPASARAHPVPE